MLKMQLAGCALASLLCSTPAFPAQYEIEYFGVPTGDTPIRGNIADYSLSFIASFEIADSAVAPNAFVHWRSPDLLSFSADFVFGAVTYSLTKASDTLAINGLGSDGNAPPAEQPGIVFSAAAQPARIGNPFTVLPGRVLLDTDSRYDFRDPRLHLSDDDTFDRVLLADGSIVTSAAAAMQGSSPLFAFGGTWLFESGDSTFQPVPNSPATGIYVITAVGGGVPPIPEPSTYALFAGGLAVLGWVAKRKRPT